MSESSQTCTDKLREKALSFVCLVIWVSLAFSSIFAGGERVFDGSLIEKNHAFALMSAIYTIVVMFLPDRKLKISQALIFILCFLVFLFVRIIFSTTYTCKWSPPLACILLITSLLTIDIKSFTKYLFVIIVSSIILSIVGILQHFGVISGILLQEIGTFDNPAGFASCLSCGLGATYIIFEKKRLNKYLSVIILVVITAGMLVSGSRAGVMALCVTLLMLLKIKPVRIVAIIILVTAILFAIRPASAIGRILIWAIVLRCFENGNLIIGNGPYSFTASYMETQASFLSSHESLLLSQIAGNVNHSFNEILELLLSFGLIGIFLFAISVLYLIRFHRNEGLAAVAPVFVVSLFSYPTQYPFVLLSICLFLTYALHSSGEYREINLNGLRFNLIPLLLSVLLFFFVAKDERFDRLWFRAAMRTEYSKQQYTSLMKEWNGNPLFLYNYAMVQKQDGNYEYAKRLLLHCCKYIKDYDVIMELAEIESSLGFVKEAIDYYCLASKMVPHKYKPKYEMMQLYCSQGDTRVARKIANDIISSPEKVQSSQVDHYKAIAREYLEKELN